MQFGKWNWECPLSGSARRWAVWGCAEEGRGTGLRRFLGVIARERPELHQSLVSAERAAGPPVVGGTKTTKELPLL